MIPKIGCDGFYYILYQTINMVNGKYYKGQHKTSNLDDDYFGSGKLLLKAIEKYGKESFKREIIGYFENRVQLNEAESKYITEKDMLSDDCYNISEGGYGNPWAGASEEKKMIWKQRIADANIGKKLSDDHKNNISNGLLRMDQDIKEKVKQINRQRYNNLSDDEKQSYGAKISEANTGKKRTDQTKENISNALTGRKHSEEHRKHNSEARKGKPNGRLGKPSGQKGVKQTQQAKEKRLKALNDRSDEAKAEHRRKISEAKKGKSIHKGRKWKINPNTGKREYYYEDNKHA